MDKLIYKFYIFYAWIGFKSTPKGIQHIYDVPDADTLTGCPVK